MAHWEFKLPDLGEGVTEGEIVAWLIKPGDVVAEDQPMVEVMTDKATVTITAPKAGVVAETRGRIGETVQVHSVLIVFDLAGGSVAAAHANGTNGQPAADERPAAVAVGEIEDTLPGMERPGATGAIEGELHAYFNERPLATPATRKLARDMNLDLRRVPPSGPQGRVTRRDVESFGRFPVLIPAARGAGGSSGTGHLEAPRATPAGLEERVPFAGLRRRIAQKMALSTRTAAHFTFVEECDVSELRALRERLKGAAEARGVRLSFLPFIVKAVVASLKKHPILNATLDEANGEIVLRKHYDIGIATATEAGLMVPVVKDADRKSIPDIAREIERLSDEARTGKAKREDLKGSTFTITSLGARGGLFATPIINFPEVAILGVHQMKERPVVREGNIVIGHVMLLSLSFDHRVVDGHVGAAFAYDVIGYLEHPEQLFFEMV
jgi:pyruvate dehydrogenase E2 component (dihydrolipoamide acetyltransferase)